LYYNPAAYIISRMKDEKSARAQEHKSIKRQEAEDRRLFSVFCPLFSVLCVLIFAGCARQQKFEPIEQIYVPDVNKAESMQIAEDVLAKMHFTIEKADYENGIIRTRPLPGAQFFEFWRSDNVGASNTLEANIHSIRRIVELHIRQKTEDRQQKTEDENLTSDICPPTSVLCIDCNVQVQRLSLPIPRKSDEPLPNENLQELTRTAGAEWSDLNKDTKLATRILKRISSMLGARHSQLDIEYRESSVE